MIECIICKSEFKDITRDVAISNNRHKICDSCLSEKIKDVFRGDKNGEFNSFEQKQ